MVQQNTLFSDNPHDDVVDLDACRKVALSPLQMAKRRENINVMDVVSARKDGSAIPIKRGYRDAVQQKSSYQSYLDGKTRDEVDARMNGDIEDMLDNPWDYAPSECNFD